mmetsp:Transcript_133591/g.236400  ORF Transcript_133591/g.236400 Transcript_133591/m.236400 type:complete len:333 (+) Transcript_133591:35-1033(+)
MGSLGNGDTAAEACAEVAKDAAAEASAEAGSVFPLRICQFNVLAPSARICKPLDTVPWRTRHEAICDELIRLEPDIMCLQEFDFAAKTEGFAALYEEKLGSKYSLHLKQRTRGKQEGLAMLLRLESFTDVKVSNYELEPGFCDRVAILGSMTHRSSGQKILVANTHLTVAHASNDHDIPHCRPLQMEQVLKLLSATSPDTSVFLCADMNSDHLEAEDSGPYSAAEVSRPVTMAFESGYTSALHSVIGSARPISHTCSYAHDGCVDYVLFKASPMVQLSSAFLHPHWLSPETQWSPATGWYPGDPNVTVSDHRPLIADFHVQRGASAAETTSA